MSLTEVSSILWRERELLELYLQELGEFLKEETGYQSIQGTRPQTLYGIADSPVGLAAWLLDHDDAGGQPAAVALAGAQHEENLRTGMAHRDVIGQAKGILMERHKLTADLAFAALVRASSVTNRKLLDIAEELVSTGHLPPTPN